MRKDYLSINQDEIISKAKEFKFHDIGSLRGLLKFLKESKLVSQTLSFDSFLRRLIDLGLHQQTLFINEKNLTKYTFQKDFDLYEFVLSLHKNSFLSMSSALNVQGLSTYRDEFIFASQELSLKQCVDSSLLQENVDKAFRKEYRRTHSVGKLKNKTIILLSPKYTDQYQVIDYKGLRVSTINRALVEMIVNVQYFRNAQEIIDVFQTIKNRIDIDTVFDVVKQFDFIYPYYQSVGFYLEKIGFTKDELKKFKEMVSNIKFYTEKSKENYSYNEYWNMYY